MHPVQLHVVKIHQTLLCPDLIPYCLYFTFWQNIPHYSTWWSIWWSGWTGSSGQVPRTHQRTTRCTSISWSVHRHMYIMSEYHSNTMNVCIFFRLSESVLTRKSMISKGWRRTKSGKYWRRRKPKQMPRFWKWWVLGKIFDYKSYL